MTSHFFLTDVLLVSYPNELDNSVGSNADLKTGRWFDPQLDQYSLRGLMIVINDRIHSSLTSVSTTVM